MSDDYQMSGLRMLILSVLRWGAMGAAMLITLFAGILLYQRSTITGNFNFHQGDVAFLFILGALLILALYLVWAIAKELKRPGE